ncbi:MAG: hypothetical protein WAV98_01220 [Minisyncoccia bacterium]
MKKISKNRGFMQIVLLAIIAIAALGYFNIDLRSVFESPIIQKVWNIFVVAWATYMKPMITYLFTSISAVFGK